MRTQTIDPKSFAKILKRQQRMDQLGLSRFIAQTAALMFVWMLVCFTCFSWIAGTLRKVLHEDYAVYTLLGCFLLMSIIFAVFQWVLTHLMIRKAGPQPQ